MKVKRSLALASAVVLALALAACGGIGGSASSGAQGSSDAAASDSQSQTSRPESGTNDQTGAKTGVGIAISLEGTRGAAESTAARARAEVTVCAAHFAKDGTILEVMFDVAEPGVDFDTDGTLATDLAAEIKTKRQLGDSYGLKGASAIGREWYQQADALQSWMAGRNVEEVLGMNTRTEEETQYADEADLTSSVTIEIGQFLPALEKAYDNARGQENTDNTQQNGSGAESSADGQSGSSTN